MNIFKDIENMFSAIVDLMLKQN